MTKKIILESRIQGQKGKLMKKIYTHINQYTSPRTVAGIHLLLKARN